MIALMNPRIVSYGLNTETPKRPNVRQAMIARRAFQLWKAHGCPAGTASKDWLEAEAQLDEAAKTVGWCYLCRDPMPADIFPR